MNFANIFLTVLLLVIAQHSSAQELYYDQYTTNDGLPSNTIYEIVQDSNGLLWMGTENGLVSYDGVTFERFTDSRLMDNDIIELEISKDGHVTFSNASNQYCRIEDTNIKIVTIRPPSDDPNSVGTIDLFSFDNVDFLYYSINSSSTSNKLYIYNNDLVDIGIDSVYVIFTSSSNSIYVVRNRKVELLNNDSGKYYTSYSNLLFESFSYSPSAILKIRGGETFLAREFGVVLRDSVIIQLAKEEKIFDVLNLKDFTYVGLYEGLLIYDKKTLKIERTLGGIKINKLFLDNENNLWVSTDRKGLLRIKMIPKPLYVFNSLTNEVEGIFGFGEQIILVSSNAILEISVSNGKCEQIQIPSKSDPIIVGDTSMFAVIGIGFILMKEYSKKNQSHSFIQKNMDDFFPKAGCFVDGKLIYADRRSVFQISDLSLNAQTEIRRKLFDLKKVQCLTYDKVNKIIYIGTSFGAYSFSFEDGLKSTDIKSLKNKSINKIFVEGDSRVWFGTSNNGVFLIEDGELKDSLTTDNSLLSNVTNDLVCKDSLVYVATSKGVSKINLISGVTSFFTVFEGLAENNVKSIFLDKEGSLIINQKRGYLTIGEADFDVKRKVYPIEITRILVNNEAFVGDLDSGFIFNHNHNKLDLGFDYYSLNKIKNKSVRYKLNEDKEWTYNSGLNIGLPSLSPGSYNLLVQGVLTNYKYTQEKNVQITILPPWWQTIWARLFGLVAIGLSIYKIVTTRGNRVKEQEAVKRENLKQRETSKRNYLQQINKIKEQALQLQMNPHFIFNSMNAIQNFITRNQDEDATIYLAKFAKLIRLIFEYSNSNLITMEAELEFVQLYIDLEELRFGNRVTCTLSVSDNVEKEKDILQVPPLLVQPIIENSFKHGLFHKLDGGEVNISYSLDGDTIVTVVEDNGIGRDASNLRQNSSYDDDRYSGLKNIMHRLEIFGFNMPKYANSMLIEDLYMNGEACGTRTILNVTIDENKKAIS